MNDFILLLFILNIFEKGQRYVNILNPNSRKAHYISPPLKAHRIYDTLSTILTRYLFITTKKNLNYKGHVLK